MPVVDRPVSAPQRDDDGTAAAQLATASSPDSDVGVGVAAARALEGCHPLADVDDPTTEELHPTGGPFPVPATDRPSPAPPAPVVGFHRLAPRRAQRVVPWAMMLIAVVQLLLGVDGPFPQPWWSLLWSLSLAMSIAQLIALHRTGTEVTPTGFCVRSGIARRRSLAWTQVVVLELPQDREATCTASLLGGERVDLPGVSCEVGQALVDAHVVRGSS